jgi:hypothetical protein
MYKLLATTVIALSAASTQREHLKMAQDLAK